MGGIRLPSIDRLLRLLKIEEGEVKPSPGRSQLVVAEQGAVCAS